MGISAVAPVGEHIKNGTLRPLAVTTLTRTPLLPDVATVAELAIPGYEATTWHGLVAPAGTPSEIVTTLHKAMMTTLNDPEVRRSLTDLGVDVAGNKPAEFGAYIRAEIPKWAAIVKASGASLD
jgi:tripartite-type tricarboxylate transporter receptor subunit TctC